MKSIWRGCALLLCVPAAALAASSDDAALDLKPAEPAAAAPAAKRDFRAYVELAAGRLSQRYGLGSDDSRRASLDLAWTFKPAAQWRLGISNRLDDIHPVDAGQRSTLNSLREAYLGWQDESGRWAVDLGRLNVRHGPAYGFNPTDYFRDGSARAVTTADPLALRENRLGTAMLRGQRLWDGGSLAVTVAPKLRDGPSDKPFSVDLGATNHSDRVLVSLGTQFGERAGLQLLAFHERGRGSQLGASATTLLGDATVAFVEWSGGRDAELLSATFDAKPRLTTAHRAALGVTFTTAGKLSLTTELEYNGFALTQAQWKQALDQVGLEAMGAYLYEVQRKQDIASRRAALLYLSQRDAFVRNLELTGLVRYNLQDHSRFLWAEARYHLPRVDVALQWQTNRGGATTEFGAQTVRSLVQLLATMYF